MAVGPRRRAGSSRRRGGPFLRVLAGPEGRGIVLPDLRLALDCAVPGFATVVGHAHADHVPAPPFAAHATAETAALVEARFAARREAGEPVPSATWAPHAYGEPFRVGAAEVAFHPSGHVLGAALVDVRSDAGSVLYTGDLKDRAPATCEPLARNLAAPDVLVVESTFGLPVFRFPSTQAASALLAREAQDAFAEAETPVFLGWSLGKAQEIAFLLGESGIPTALHGAAWRMTEVYAARGWAIPSARRYDGAVREGEALVVPPSARAHPLVTGLRSARVALVSGWARLDNRRAQADVDGLVPLSDHADFAGLRGFVRDLAPARVVANHGYAAVFAHVLRGDGFRAEALGDEAGEEIE